MKYDIKPFIKWAGGKRQLIPQIEPHIPEKFNTYFEPFLGAGALLFHLQPTHAVVNDFNKELVEAYITIKENSDKLLNLLTNHSANNSKQHFYEVRSWDRDENYFINKNIIERSARLIYMNRVGFNGLFRVNSKGHFNVPYGRYKRPLIDNKPLIKSISDYLNNNSIKLLNGDFTNAVKSATAGDFVYFDPPYDPISDTSAFTKYQKDGFDKYDQIRLKRCADELVKKGVKVILSNSNTEFINDLYNNKLDDAKSDVKYFFVNLLDARRSINSDGKGRGKIKEVLIISDDKYFKYCDKEDM